MIEFNKYLRNLRLEHNLSLREVQAKAGVSSSYLAQIEQGHKPRPSADILKKLAPIFDVPVRDLMKAAGYLEEAASELSDKEEIEMAFRYVMSDPRYKSGTRLSGELTPDVKRFIVEMYEKATGKKLLSGS
ncbi:MAG: helix-turn-helix domain-containing protein [Dehalogenimonas sp.]